MFVLCMKENINATLRYVNLTRGQSDIMCQFQSGNTGNKHYKQFSYSILIRT